MRVYKIKNALSSERNKLLKNTRFISPVFLVKNVYVTQTAQKVINPCIIFIKSYCHFANRNVISVNTIITNV